LRFCMVGLGVGIEAGGISPEISPAWAVDTVGCVSTSAIINSIPDEEAQLSREFARRVGKTWRSNLEERPSGREDGRAKMGACRSRPPN